jgi:hypothetical protein
MVFLQETTDWEFPNHIYVLDDAKEKMLAFINCETNEHKVFKKPIKFDKRYRTFSKIKVDNR